MLNRFEAIQQRLARFGDFQVDKTIHPSDNMFDSGMERYLSTGLSAIHVISHAMALTGRVDFENILDLPCGFGRVLRHLVGFFPQSTVVACDLDREAVEFCRDTFHVEGYYSKEHLEEVEFAMAFDLIWCGSLLTHLDEEKFSAALRFLISCLSDSGVVVLTLHGRFMITVQEKYHKLLPDPDFEVVRRGFDETGFGYYDYQDSELTIDSNYGVSLSAPSYVMGIVEKIPDVQIESFQERAWSGVHDVLILSKKSISRGF